MALLIDGHNLLHSVQRGGKDFEPISDLRLCRIISEYLKQTSEKGEIIFDGTGPRVRSGFDNISGLEVFFAGQGSDADTIIEDKIKINTAPRSLTVVSSDRRLRDAAQARKATVLKSQVFWNNLCRQLGRKRTTKEPAAKRGGLSESETEQWLKFFGLEQ